MRKEKEFRRSLPVFPIGTMMMLTELSARQIRYYEDQGLITPERTATNRRLYSLNDVDRLLEIKDYLADGLTMVAIKKVYFQNLYVSTSPMRQLTDKDVRRIIQEELCEDDGR